jgi:hypothetical protein
LCIRDAYFPCNTNTIYLWDSTLAHHHKTGVILNPGFSRVKDLARIGTGL